MKKHTTKTLRAGVPGRASKRSPTAPTNEVLVTFAREALAGYQDGVVGDIDGGWLQDRALELGLLVPSDGNDGLYVIAEWLANDQPAMCGAVEPLSRAVCERPQGHVENHLGSGPHYISSWPK